MENLPDDLRIAYETFVLVATKHKMLVAGMMVGSEPISITVIGNATERGRDFAKLLREFAKIVEDKTDKGQIHVPPARNVN